jgi:3-hydroxyacyl-CoA dehydrogenase
MMGKSEIQAPVALSRDGNIAVITIDNPPVNASSAAVRRGLLEAIETVDASPDYDGAIIIGAGKTFIAGSDLKEFDLPLEEPQLPSVIKAIETSAKPFVAALHGAALGGGYELALGCDARIAAPGAVVGLPETTLGIIPGAGGSQRLPRLTGIPTAIEIICSGRRVGTEEAIELHMIDAIAGGELKSAAIEYARTLARSRRKSRVIDQPVPEAEADAVAASEKEALRKGRGRPHLAQAIAHIKATSTVDPAEGLAAERASFQILRVGQDAKAMRHLFFAERQARRSSFAKTGSKRPVHHVGVVGAGTMGSGIAMAFLDAGLSVNLMDSSSEALTRAPQTISGWLDKRVSAGKLSRVEADLRLSKLQVSSALDDLSDCSLIIEAAIEDLGAKKHIFERLGALTAPGTLLASNTSYLDIDAIAAASGRAEDVLGLHFFSPAHITALLEIVRGEKTSADALATGLAIAERLGKQPIVARNGFGFIGNRLYSAYRRECEYMLEDGALPHEVDAALEGFGMSMGPFAVADMSGLDIAWRMRQALAAERDPSSRYVHIPDRLCEAGRFGRKTGSGYYDYSSGTKQRDPFVEALIVEASQLSGVKRSAIDPDTIVRRALVALANEAALVMAEGIAETPETIDVAMASGYGFPRWQGGPVFWARNQEASKLAEDCETLVRVSRGAARRGDLTLIGMTKD